MRIVQPRFNIRRAAFILIASMLTASCSDKSAPGHETNANSSEVETAEVGDEPQPDKDKIEEDCAAFVRATKVLPAKAAATDCPGCPAEGRTVLALRGLNMDAISCSGDTCIVMVTIRAVYVPGSGASFSGGLTAWLPPEQRNAYLNGQAPTDEQSYRVKITYKRRDTEWRAVEFDRAPVE